MAANRPRKKPEPVPKKKQYKLFNWFNRFIPLDRFFAETDLDSAKDERVPIRYFNYLAWVIFLLVVYERIGYWSEQNVRQSIKLTHRAEEMRAEYTSIMAAYMKSGKQSAILSKVAADSLRERMDPPHKIVVSKSDFNKK